MNEDDLIVVGLDYDQCAVVFAGREWLRASRSVTGLAECVLAGVAWENQRVAGPGVANLG
jgi:hypothetical protein